MRYPLIFLCLLLMSGCLPRSDKSSTTSAVGSGGLAIGKPQTEIARDNDDWKLESKLAIGPETFFIYKESYLVGTGGTDYQYHYVLCDAAGLITKWQSVSSSSIPNNFLSPEQEKLRKRAQSELYAAEVNQRNARWRADQTVHNKKTEQEVIEGREIHKDDFKKYTVVTTPDLMDWNQGILSLVLGFSTTSDGRRFFIRIIASQHEWAFYESATFADGSAAKFRSIDRDASGHGVVEQFALDVTEQYLRDHQQQGLKFRVYGKRANMDWEIPPHYISGILKLAESEKSP